MISYLGNFYRHLAIFIWSHWRAQAAYQSNEDAPELDNVGVGDGVESADPGVHDGDEGAQDDGRVDLHVDDHGQRSA